MTTKYNLMASIGEIFKKKSGGSLQNRRTSADSLGFQVSKSKSLENLEIHSDIKDLCTFTELRLDEHWKEVDMLKTLGPHIVCILPSLSLDFVVSSLYAIGANPLIPEDVDDVEHLLNDCKGVLLDISAREALIEAFITHHVTGVVPLVLVTTNCGTDDRRKALARKVIEKCEPTLISGRLGDIKALAQDICERADGILEDGEDVDTIACSVSSHLPSVTTLVGRRSPLPGRRSPGCKKRASPPNGSPLGSPRFQKKDKTQLGRFKTPIPHLVMKGQFRHQGMKDVSIPECVLSGQALAGQTGHFVHIFEVNMLTCGEFFLEITNTQLGMENLHSTVQCAAAVMTSILACVEEEGQEVALVHCAHGLGMYHVAAEMASIEAANVAEFPPPGTLRMCLIDKLQQIDELVVRLKTLLVKHNEAPEQK